MDVRVITQGEQWDAFLQAHEQGHILQSYGWGQLQKYLGVRVYYLGAVEEEQLVGTMLLVVATVPLPGPLARLNLKWLYCSRGPAVSEPAGEVLSALTKAAHGVAERERAVVLRLEPNIVEDDPQIDTWLATFRSLGFQVNPIAIHGRRSWTLDLRPDTEKLFAQFRKGWRYDIRAAERHGVRIREAESDADFDAYYHLLELTSTRDNFFIHRKDYHKEMWQYFKRTGNAVLFLAELEGEPVSAKMLLRLGSWCYDMFGATSNTHPKVPKTHLVQFHCIKWAKEQGCIYFDFRTIPEVLEPGAELWGVYHFKSGFGGFSRLAMPTQDYVYRPLLYKAWRKIVEMRRAERKKRLEKKE